MRGNIDLNSFNYQSFTSVFVAHVTFPDVMAPGASINFSLTTVGL